jgi:RNA polymerase sigma factor (sigma-70 family)
MRPVTASALKRASLRHDADHSWRERAGRLFGEFEGPARTMVRRAFRGAFSNDELDDIYASAWVGTLRALAGRQAKLSDEEIRSYVFTAVANQAGKELRRRRRKPTAPLELIAGVPDPADTPEDRVAGAEQSRVTRDLLTSLPPRRRAVMLLRFGWGLEPSQVCGLINGLSPRAYRKEITRGIEELTEKMRTLERGEWCAEREPTLRAYAAGLADADQSRQAQAHLSHCRDCSDFVARLSGHLHDLGGAVIVPEAIAGIDGHVSLGDRLLDLGEKARETATGLLARGGSGGSDEVVAQVTAAGGARGAGVAGAGVLAKVAGLGTAGKLAVACLGGGVAASACVAAGVAPFGFAGDPERATQKRPAPSSQNEVHAVPAPAPDSLPSQVGHGYPPPAETSPSAAAPPEEPVAPASQEPEPVEPLAPSTPPVQREFGVPAAATPPASGSPSASASGDAGGDGSAVQQEFGP